MSDAPDTPRRDWLPAACVAALVISFGDAILLQLRRDYFTGGFLIEDAATSGGLRSGFAVASILTDLALTAPLSLLASWLGRRVPLGRGPRIALLSVIVVLPFAAADAVAYELASFLGEAFDLSLMFDLVNQRVIEVLAVSWTELLQASAILGVVALLSVYVATRYVRWSERAPVETTAMVGRRDVIAATGLLVLLAVTSTVVRGSSAVLENGIRRKPSGRTLGAVVERLTDVDGDGVGWGRTPPDPDPFDPARHPYAVDWPGNGIDENGLAGDLPAGRSYEEPSGAPPRFARVPTVVLIVLESVRGDVLGTSLNGRRVTPVLDALAAQGVAHPRAYSHNGYTVQSRYHLMAGSLAEQRSGTLVDDFAANGYETAYFSGQDESFGIEHGRFDTGFGRAAIRYDARQDVGRRVSTFSTPGSLLVPSGVLLGRLTRFLHARDASRPLFLVLGLGDTHFPYSHRMLEPLLGVTPLPRTRLGPATSAALRDTYLQALANVDRAIGRAIEAVSETTRESPVVIVLSDHGESLYDQGFLGHGYALNEAQTRIPLVAAGLDVTLPDPFGQADLRDAIRGALSRGALSDRPRLVPRATGPVFQYLGVIDRPRAVALLLPDGRAAYDFRADTFRVAEGPAVPVADLDDSQRRRWHCVIHAWERMVQTLAGARGWRAGQSAR